VRAKKGDRDREQEQEQERERDRDRDRDREKGYRETERQRNRETEKQRDRETERERPRNRETYPISLRRGHLRGRPCFRCPAAGEDIIVNNGLDETPWREERGEGRGGKEK
jgi:hypothetical protein